MTDAEPSASLPADLVVDASVAAKWLLRDEDDLAHADALLAGLDSGVTIAYAPCQIDVEIAATLRKAVLTRRITVDDASGALETWFDDLRPKLRLAENDDLLPDALPMSFAFGITVFDALYVTLARTLETIVVVADRRLARSPALRLSAVRTLSSIPFQKSPP